MEVSSLQSSSNEASPTFPSSYTNSLSEWWHMGEKLSLRPRTYASELALPVDGDEELYKMVVLPQLYRPQSKRSKRRALAKLKQNATIHYHIRETVHDDAHETEAIIEPKKHGHPHIPPVGNHLSSKPPKIPGLRKSARFAVPLETMLPRLRSGDVPTLVPQQNVVVKSGITSLVNRGFMPPDADFSPLVSLKADPRAARRPDISAAYDPQEHTPLGRQHVLARTPAQLRPMPVTTICTAEPSSAADLRSEPVVDRQHEQGKRVLTTVAKDAHWRYVRPSRRVRVVIPADLTRIRLTSPTMTPAQSVLAPSVDEEGLLGGGSQIDLFSLDAARAVTARLIAASREGPLIAINQGKTARHAPPFLRYRKSCGDDWEAADWIIRKFEDFMQDYAVPYAELISKCVTQLAAAPLKTCLTRSDILSCVANSAEVNDLVNTPGQRYRGRDGVAAAAAKIQATFRMWIMRRIHFWHIDRVWAANVFIKFWKVKVMRRNVEQQCRNQYTKVHLRRFHRLMLRLKDEMGGIMAHKRVVIQLVPSKAVIDPMMTSHEFQVGRTHVVTDPLVETIFVTPQVDETRIAYFRQILGCGFPDHNPMDEERVRFIVPEAARCFPPSAPLATMLLCSRRALASLRKMCQGRSAMIICDVVGEAEVTLSSALSIPVLGPTPEAYAQHLSTRAKARDFLRSAGVPVAPALESHAINEAEMNLHIVKAISMFPDVPLWTLNPDPFVHSITGKEREGPYALLDPSSLTFAKDLYETTDTAQQPNLYDDSPHSTSRPASTQTHPTMRSAVSSLTMSIAAYNRPVTAPPVPQTRPRTARRGMIASHLQLARREVPDQTKILVPQSGWSELVRLWVKSGGILMGLPGKDSKDLKCIDVGIDVDMTGKWKFLVIGETLYNHDKYTPSTLVVSNVPAALHQDLSPFLDRIATNCASNGIIGTLTVEFTVWVEAAAPYRRQYWATHLRPQLTATLLRANTVLLATACKSDQKDWKAKFPRNDIPLQIRYATGARFMDQSKIKQSFYLKKIAALSAIENRTAVYVYGLEHSQIAVMRRASTIATLETKGVGFDVWTRTDIVLKAGNAGRLFMDQFMAFRCVEANYEAALESAVRTLLKINVVLDDCTAECIDQDGSVYRNNFVSVATRLLYELQGLKDMPPPATRYATSRKTSPFVQEAFRLLGVVPQMDVLVEPPPSLFRPGKKGKRGVTFEEEDSGSDSDPEIVDPVDSTIKWTRIVRARSAAPTAASDLAMLVSQFFTVPVIKPREPTVAALKRRAEAANLRKARRRAGFSTITAALLNEGISSEFAANQDDEFAHPPLSPPYSRRASEKAARALSGRSRRGRAMLDKLEKEMDERTRKGVIAEAPVYKGKLRHTVHAETSVEDAAAAAAAAFVDYSTGYEDIVHAEPRLPPKEVVRVPVHVQPLRTEPSQAFPPSDDDDLAPSLDLDSVLEKLQDVAARGERLSEFLDEKMHNSQKILGEHHKTHLEMLEKRKTDAEARMAQKRVMDRRAAQKDAEAKGLPFDEGLKPLTALRRSNSTPAHERLSVTMLELLRPSQ
ncbi:hypothetical protein HKX48_007473 [Thoreauomyces humboldtii]|nr:hypothetical protein HKX48_007473 [Thoreauomyces humboldtii]